MTISSSLRKAGPYSCNGSTDVFPFAFKVFSSADLRVVLTDSGNVETDLDIGTHYSVTLNANQDSNPGGTIQTAAPYANGYRITLTSKVPNMQPVTLTNQGGFYPRVINDALDRATIQIQQIAEEVGRAFKSPISSDLTPDELFASLYAVGVEARASADEAAVWAAAAQAATSHVAYFVGGASLKDLLATGKRVLIPASVSSIPVSAADSPAVLPKLGMIDAVAPVTLLLDAGVHATTTGNVANVGNNGRLTIEGAAPISTTLSSVASVSGAPGNYTVVLNLADASGIAAGHYLKIDNAVPLVHLSGDLSVYRQRVARNELLRTSAMLGTVTAATGGGSVSWSSIGAGALSDYVAEGDLVTIKGQTRQVVSVGASSANISGAWALGVAGSSDYFVSRPNSGTVSTGGVSSASVAGSGSAFAAEANVGDLLLCDGQMAVITAIGSAAGLTVSPAVTIAAGSPYSIITPAVAHEGTHRVTAVAGNAVTVLNRWRGPFAPPVNRVSGGDVKAIRTVLYNSGSGDGFSFGQGASIALLNNLVVRGSNGSTGTHGIALNGRTAEGPTQLGPTGICCTGDGFAAVEWGRGAFVGTGGNLQSRRSHYCGNLNFGVWAMENATIGMREVVVSGTSGRGVQANAGAVLLFTEGQAVGNASDGVNLLDGATLYGEIPFFWQNGGMGLRIGGTAGCHLSNGAVGLNAASGVYAHFGAVCDLSLALFVGNARENLEAYGGATLYAAGLWSVGCRGTAGNGRGLYAENARISAADCAITGNSGGPVELYGANSTLDAPASYMTGAAGGGVRVRSGASAVLSNGRPELVTAATGGEILIENVSPAPTVAGVARVNERANDGALVSTASGSSTGVAALAINGGSRVTFFKMVTQVFDCPSIPAGGQQSTTVTVTGAAISGMVALANSNSMLAGVSLSAHIASADTVTVTLNNNSGAAIDPGNATLTVIVIGSS